MILEVAFENTHTPHIYIGVIGFSVSRKTRDELSHNVFLMLQETNKFREHQAREILIEILEKQLAEREKLLKELQDGIERADSLLGDSPIANKDAMDTN